MENMLCDLAIWKKRGRGFGEIVFGVLKKSFSAFWRNRSAFFGKNRSEIWRTLFGEIVVGDLEKSFGDFGENRSAILEIIMEYRNARRPYAEIES